MNKWVLIIFASFALVSCGICKHCPCKNYIDHDSTAVHHKDSTAIRDSAAIRDSIIQVPLPTEASQSILPIGQHSHLETSLAESDAYVDSLGLHHTLNNKEGTLDAHVPVVDHYHNEYQYHQKDSTNIQEHTQIGEVKKPLTWWQKFRINAFWWLVGGIIILLLWTFRKSILKIL